MSVPLITRDARIATGKNVRTLWQAIPAGMPARRLRSRRNPDTVPES